MSSRVDAHQAISAVIERLEGDQSLYLQENFIERMKALDVLESQLLDEIEAIDDGLLTEAKRLSFVQRSQALKLKLDESNQRLFDHLVERIRTNDFEPVIQYFRQAARQISRTSDNDTDYDELDMLVNGLLEVETIPEESRKRDRDMMFYQPTHARIVLKLIDELNLTENVVFYDLGSGLGHVPILISLLTGIKTKGVERDDAYVSYSEERLKKLRLENVEFINDDARDVDYADGTVFYMYTPFRGELLEEVLSKLEAISKQKPIRVCAYGPCTLQVSKAGWLQAIYETGKRESHFAIFRSF